MHILHVYIIPLHKYIQFIRDSFYIYFIRNFDTELNTRQYLKLGHQRERERERDSVLIMDNGVGSPRSSLVEVAGVGSKR